jgi:hypothetical protein
MSLFSQFLGRKDVNDFARRPLLANPDRLLYAVNFIATFFPPPAPFPVATPSAGQPWRRLARLERPKAAGQSRRRAANAIRASALQLSQSFFDRQERIAKQGCGRPSPCSRAYANLCCLGVAGGVARHFFAICHPGPPGHLESRD